MNDVMYDACFLYRTVVNSVVGDSAVLAHSLSLLWKYLMVVMDQLLYEKQ